MQQRGHGSSSKNQSAGSSKFSSSVREVVGRPLLAMRCEVADEQDREEMHEEGRKVYNESVVIDKGRKGGMVGGS